MIHWSHYTRVDTVSFFYTRKIVMVSPICGFTNDFTITGVNSTHKAIDTLIIKNPNLSATDEENIRIYY